MANEVQSAVDFQERLFKKIRTDIGELMTDEELKKLVATAVDRTFFTPEKRLNPNGSSYRNDQYIEYPPMIQQIVKELLEPGVKAAIREWLDAHSAEVKAQVDAALADGMTGAVSRAINGMLSNAFYTLQQNLMTAMQNMPR